MRLNLVLTLFLVAWMTLVPTLAQAQDVPVAPAVQDPPPDPPGQDTPPAPAQDPPPAPPTQEVPPAPATRDTPPADGLDDLRAEYRSARTAVVMTFPVPGWGQLYADAPFWGVAAFGAQMFYLGNILMELRRQERQKVKRDQETDPNLEATRSSMVDEHGEKARDYVWWAAGIYLVVALDAFVSVELADFDSEEPPTPDLDRNWQESGDDGGGMALQLNFSF